MNITVELDISARRIADLMVTAIEGGINYWCKGIYLEVPNVKEIKHAWWYDYAPLYDRDDLRIKVAIHDDAPRKIGKVDFAEGAKIMAAKYPWHWADFTGENEDAITADVFVQCVVFKEIVYG